MASLNINMSGFKELQARLQEMATVDATKAGQSAIRSGGKIALNAIKADAPVGSTPEGATESRHSASGGTRKVAHHKITNSLKIGKVNTPNEHQVSVAIGAGKAFQASWEEFGSIHNAATHFMERGLTNSTQEIIDAVSKALNKQIIKRGGPDA
jgi:HK97 gp10 family phage protein